MATMRVVQVSRAGGPLELVERPVPDPGRGMVRVKVEACGICHNDVITKEGAAALQALGGASAILATVTDGAAMSAVVGGLGLNGTMLLIGVPPTMTIAPLSLLSKRASLRGWYSGTAIDSQDTLASAPAPACAR